MTYRCNCCGARFDEPFQKTIRENLDGENGWWTHTDEFCPNCSSDEIEEDPEEDELF